MGYDVHITRKENWFDENGPEIALAEWIAVVESDPEMRLDGHAEAPVEGGMLRLERDGLSVWTAYSGNGKDGNMAWFDFRDGNVVVKNPDAEMRTKMCALARRLTANVQGDEGELYDGSGHAIHPVANASSAPAASRPWWRFW